MPRGRDLSGRARQQHSSAHVWCLPWSLAAGFVTGLGRGLKASPLLWLAWRCRLVVASIAVVQLSNDGHWPMAAVVAGIAAATYTQPALARWCSARVAATGDREVVGLGLGVQYARLLAAGGHAIGLERHVALTAVAGASNPTGALPRQVRHVADGSCRQTPGARTPHAGRSYRALPACARCTADRCWFRLTHRAPQSGQVCRSAVLEPPGDGRGQPQRPALPDDEVGVRHSTGADPAQPGRVADAGHPRDALSADQARR